MTRSSIRVRPAEMSMNQATFAPPRRVNEANSRALHTSRCVKYTMFFKNMFFLLCGVFVGAIGAVALREKDKLLGKFDDLFLDPAVILLCVGIVIFVISFCGALGALRENKCLLRFFYITVILITVTELALVGAFYGYREKLRENVDGVFQDMILRYQDDPDLQAVIDYIQQEVKCCGSTKPDDWANNRYYNCSSLDIVSACSVPRSCCKTDRINRLCGRKILEVPQVDRQEKVFTVGCLEALETWLKDNILYAGIALGCLLVLQLIAVRLAFWLISDINEIIKWRDAH